MNHVFLKAARKEAVPYTPVWYMRQAGRYQPEYRAIREKHSFFDISHQPELCARVTSLPVKQLGVDAAILFADIMTPLKARGLSVDIVEGVGPVIPDPVRSGSDLAKLGELVPERDVPYVLETVERLRKQLEVPLIGFAGAPFTLASYLIEGGPSKDYHRTKAFMYRRPDDWAAIMNHLAEMTVRYLKAQIDAGAAAIQVFDSWVGALSSEDYRTYIMPAMVGIFSALKETEAVTIYFAAGAAHLLHEWNELPVDVLSIDWRTSPAAVRGRGIAKVLQGNLDPALLLAPLPLLKERARRLLDETNGIPGFIFNLGHGVFPEVRPETLKALTDFIHDYSKTLREQV
ncbi:uroporphyrinogen decarboxylase [Sporolactobacillus sp. THM7-7]|nr:uroporphyrinogen decarboxylase [Sporolactobacillus sp. THM7-7]